MLLFTVFYSVAEVVLVAVVVFQFIYLLVTGQRHERALSLGSQISAYIYQIIRYLTYNTEDRPFPFADWPSDVPLQPAKPARKRAPARQKTAENSGDKASKKQVASKEE
jgi:hypothetical protein